MAQFSLNNAHKVGIKYHHFIFHEHLERYPYEKSMLVRLILLNSVGLSNILTKSCGILIDRVGVVRISHAHNYDTLESQQCRTEFA